MAINWGEINSGTSRSKARKDLMRVITADNYGTNSGQWNFTDLAITQDSRVPLALQIIEGSSITGKPDQLRCLRGEDGQPFRAVLRVLTRQACYETEDGRRIWERASARELHGDPDDLLPEFDELPKPGDVVRWKGSRIEIDPETGDEVTSKTIKRWALQGKDATDYVRFRVNDGGCIEVPYPYCLSMLRRNGRALGKPRFRKIDKNDKTVRKLTNWWFVEVDPSATNIAE